MKLKNIAENATTPNMVRYYVLRNRRSGAYYSHRVDGKVVTVRMPDHARIRYPYRDDAAYLAYIEGRDQWEVVHFDTENSIRWVKGKGSKGDTKDR